MEGVNAFRQQVQACADKITEIFSEAAARLRMDEPMAAHSSFRVGGPADLVFYPVSPEEIVLAIRTAKSLELPYTILGNGSNILVSDKGIRGLTIILGDSYASIREEAGGLLAVDAGALLSTVAKFAAKEGLTGMEFAAGIPGSIGGAVYMNAGAYDGCMADIVRATEGYDPETDDVFMLDTVQAHRFGYRHSCYEQNGSIVLRIWLGLKRGDIKEIEAKMADFAARRRQSQPLEFPSAGSTFKRPTGYFAGRLIEEAGLKGKRIGGACVSTKHAGFIINDCKASAKDILDLIHDVQECVYKESGVAIDPEIRILGEW